MIIVRYRRKQFPIIHLKSISNENWMKGYRYRSSRILKFFSLLLEKLIESIEFGRIRASDLPVNNLLYALIKPHFQSFPKNKVRDQSSKCRNTSQNAKVNASCSEHSSPIFHVLYHRYTKQYKWKAKSKLIMGQIRTG